MISLTGGLVVVSAIQAWILRRQTDIIARSLADSQEATRLAHQSLVLSERPRLTVRNIVIDEPNVLTRLHAELSEGTTFTDPLHGTLSLSNSGNGKAIVRSSYCRIFNSREPQRLPMKWPYSADAGGELIAQGTVIEPGEAVECRFSGVGPSLDDYMGEILRDATPGQRQLYVLGRVEYADELGLTRPMAFCRQYHRGFERFVRVDDPDYENAD